MTNRRMHERALGPRLGEAIGGPSARLIGNAAVCRGRDLEITENQVVKTLARRQLARVLGDKKELGR
jgi:hypothetical protein